MSTVREARFSLPKFFVGQAIVTAGGLALQAAFQAAAQLCWFGRGADTRVCSAETHLGAAFLRLREVQGLGHSWQKPSGAGNLACSRLSGGCLDFGHFRYAVGRPVWQAIVPAARKAEPEAAAFQAALKPGQISRRRARVFFGFVSFRVRAAKPEKLVRRRGSRLKAGCSQDWLPHEGPSPRGRLKPAAG